MEHGPKDLIQYNYLVVAGSAGGGAGEGGGGRTGGGGGAGGYRIRLWSISFTRIRYYKFFQMSYYLKLQLDTMMEVEQGPSDGHL